MYHPYRASTIERVIVKALVPNPRRPLIDDLNSAYMVQMVKARAVRNSRNPVDIATRKRAEKAMLDLAEQIRVWKIMSDQDGKQLHEALCVRRFERETERMEAAQ